MSLLNKSYSIKIYSFYSFKILMKNMHFLMNIFSLKLASFKCFVIYTLIIKILFYPTQHTLKVRH